MTVIETERLRLRNWIDDDRDLFREIFSDPKVMEFFPYRRTHTEADELLIRARSLIEDNGFGFFCVALKETDEPIGFCGVSRTDLEPALRKGTVEIGWRLATRYWGNGYVTEAAHALLDFGFREKGFDEIVSFAVLANRRSIAVMERLGMTRVEGGEFNHPRVPDSHPQLKRHALYRMTAQQFSTPD